MATVNVNGSSLQVHSQLDLDVDGVELFLTNFEIFWRPFDGVVIYFFNSNFKFLDDALEFSVTSLYVVFIFSSKFMLIFLMIPTK